MRVELTTFSLGSGMGNERASEDGRGQHGASEDGDTGCDDSLRVGVATRMRVPEGLGGSASSRATRAPYFLNRWLVEARRGTHQCQNR